MKLNPDGQPDYVVVGLDDPLLYRCPQLYLEDAGTAQFTDEEVLGLRSMIRRSAACLA